MVLRSYLASATLVSLFSTGSQQHKSAAGVLPKPLINNRINLLVTMAVQLLLGSQLADAHASDLRAEISQPICRSEPQWFGRRQPKGEAFDGPKALKSHFPNSC